MAPEPVQVREMWPNFNQHGEFACHYLLYAEHMGCVGDIAFKLAWIGALAALVLGMLAAQIGNGAIRRLSLSLILAMPFAAAAAWAFLAYLPVPFVMRFGSLVVLMIAPLLVWLIGSAIMFLIGRRVRMARHPSG
jgi:hypothetical protein